MSISCCPPNSHVYLAADYSAVGMVQSLPNGTEIYSSGTLAVGKNAVLVIPDIWGWNGGRTRNVVDQFAEAGYFAVVPKLLVPALDQGTDGDGLPPDFSFQTRGADFGPYISTITWQDVIKPKVTEVINYLKEAGINKIAVLGFCWGGVMVAHIADEFVSAGVVCGAIPHPSWFLEDKVYGGSSAALVGAVKVPLLLLPSGNDPDDLRAGGALFEILKANNPDSITLSTEFSDMAHGWSVRGDTKDEAIKAKVELAFNHIYDFFAKFM